MTLAELKVLIGSLTNDPNHERYTEATIETELDISQTGWNVEIGVLKGTGYANAVDGVREYSIASMFSETPIKFLRATHKGLKLEKRDKSWFDLYIRGTDWTTLTGTPTAYYVDATEPDELSMFVHPTPTGNDVGLNNIALEAIGHHKRMTDAADVPFTDFWDETNHMLRPYDWGLAYEVAARLLARDPSEINASKSVNYKKISDEVKSNLIQVFKSMEAEEPKRMGGGRYWTFGNAILNK